MDATNAPAEAVARPPVCGEPQAVKGQHRTKTWLALILKVLKFVLDQWLIIGFGLACLFGYLWPNVAASGGVIRSQYSILYGAVAIIFLVSGLQLSPQKLRQNVFNWRLHVVTQGISFVVIPLIWLAIIWIIIAAGDLRTHVIETPVLLGMLVLSCLPTTIASNVVMTRNAGGDDAAAIIEVVLGNVFGSFLCPLLIYGFMPDTPEFRPWKPASLPGLSRMYRDVAMQLGLSVLVPIAAGQALRVLFEDKVMWCLQKLYLAKISTFFLCTLVWATFSNAFKTGAIYQLPKSSIAFNIVMNVVLYALFTVICFTMARPPQRLVVAVNKRLDRVHFLPSWVRRVIAPKQMAKEQAVAVCFCGAAKTTSLGIPLVSAMWAQKDDLTRAFLAIPVLLYTMEQVFLAQLLVYLFRHYLKRDEARKEGSVDTERAGPGVASTGARADEVGGAGVGADEKAGEREGVVKPEDHGRPDSDGAV